MPQAKYFKGVAVEAAGLVPASELSTGSKTIADLFPLAAAKYGDKVAIKHKDAEGVWQEVTYKQANSIISEIARGLIALGVEHGDRVCILSNTRAEWSYCDFAIASTGAVVVPIYPTNSPEECEWVVGNSQAKVIVCEDASQVEKITKVRTRLPALQAVVVIDPEGVPSDTVSLTDLRGRAASVSQQQLDERIAQTKPEDSFTFIYTSGTTGPPKGCVLTHGNYRSVVSMGQQVGIAALEDIVYLFLPLAHGFALVVQLVAFDSGATIAYFGGDTKQIVGELADVKPTFLPSVPRIFEKVYTMASSYIATQPPEQQERFKEAIELGLKVRVAQAKGETVSGADLERFQQLDNELLANVRQIFGGRLRFAVTGAAPIAPEILQFFYACGVPIFEGYGMTETSTVSTIAGEKNFKFGTVGQALPGVEIKIAEDGEVLLKGANIFQGYYNNPNATAETLVDGWLHTGDLGSLDSDGFLTITGRKKDIIITAGGKNITPSNLENDLKQSRWISQAVMHGDRRPYPVALITLDPEEIVAFASQHGLPEDIPSLAREPKIRELIQGELDKVNEKYAQVEQIKKFAILDHDLSQETGELTPTLKVKRNVVNEKYTAVFEALYAEG